MLPEPRRWASLLGGTSCLLGLFLASCSSEDPVPDGGVGGGSSGATGASGSTGTSGFTGASGAAGTSTAGAPAGGSSGVAGGSGSGASSAGVSSGGSAGVAGAALAGGAPSAGAASGGRGGSTGASGAGAAGASSGAGGSIAGGSGGGANEALAKFSFFVTSIQAMRSLSGDQKGFGGDLRFGKADGLSGADEICRQAAELGTKGAGTKTWRAFLSAVGPPAVHARDRIGSGPWYDAKGRLVSANLADLLGAARPKADPAIANDLPNERGEPNHYVGEAGYTPATEWDNHDTLTGSNADGTLYGTSKSATCQDWTSSAGNGGQPRLGHSWPRSKTSGMGAGWASDHNARGCAPGFYLDFAMPAGSGDCVGCGGGYGGIYCFALTEP